MHHDLALATETASRRPNRPTDWDAIAAKLSEQFSTPGNPVQLKGRSCRERVDLLLRKYVEEDKKSLKR